MQVDPSAAAVNEASSKLEYYDLTPNLAPINPKYVNWDLINADSTLAKEGQAPPDDDAAEHSTNTASKHEINGDDPQAESRPAKRHKADTRTAASWTGNKAPVTEMRKSAKALKKQRAKEMGFVLCSATARDQVCTKPKEGPRTYASPLSFS